MNSIQWLKFDWFDSLKHENEGYRSVCHWHLYNAFVRNEKLITP